MHANHIIGFTNHNGYLQPVQEEHITDDGPTCILYRIGHPGMVMLERPHLSIDFYPEEQQLEREPLAHVVQAAC